MAKATQSGHYARRADRSFGLTVDDRRSMNIRVGGSTDAKESRFFWCFGVNYYRFTFDKDVEKYAVNSIQGIVRPKLPLGSPKGVEGFKLAQLI